jgi:hypothetical protein
MSILYDESSISLLLLLLFDFALPFCVQQAPQSTNQILRVSVHAAFTNPSSWSAITITDGLAPFGRCIYDELGAVYFLRPGGLHLRLNSSSTELRNVSGSGNSVALGCLAKELNTIFYPGDIGTLVRINTVTLQSSYVPLWDAVQNFEDSITWSSCSW